MKFESCPSKTWLNCFLVSRDVGALARDMKVLLSELLICDFMIRKLQEK